MAIDTDIEVTLQDLRAIIHGLKMLGLGFVEEGALDEIKAMIQALPGPEKLNEIALTPNSLKGLQKDVGGIMSLIDSYGNRDKEYKVRYKSRTGLPPRYKVLDWSVQMEQAARNFVRELVKTSAMADENGHEVLASELLQCAKFIREGKTLENELPKVVEELEKVGMKKEASVVKEAQVMPWMKGLWQGVKDVGGQMAQTLLDPARLEKTKAKLQNIINEINKEMQYGLQVADKAQGPVQAQIKSLVNTMSEMSLKGNEALGNLEQVISSPEVQQQEVSEEADIREQYKSVMYKGETLPIQWDEEGIAFVDTPDGKFKVQEDEVTKERSLAPYASPEIVQEQVSFQSQQPVKFNGKDAVFVQELPNGMAQIQYSSGAVMAVNLQKLINENQVMGEVPQQKTPVVPSVAPIAQPTASNKFNLKRYSSRK